LLDKLEAHAELDAADDHEGGGEKSQETEEPAFPLIAADARSPVAMAIAVESSAAATSTRGYAIAMAA
jgi:hypothetical protein